MSDTICYRIEGSYGERWSGEIKEGEKLNLQPYGPLAPGYTFWITYWKKPGSPVTVKTEPS